MIYYKPFLFFNSKICLSYKHLSVTELNVVFSAVNGKTGPESHLVLLPLQSLHVVELLRLQRDHPFMQLIDLIPAGDTRTREHENMRGSDTETHLSNTMRTTDWFTDWSLVLFPLMLQMFDFFF